MNKVTCIFQAVFSHPDFALVKTFAVMIGELDYAAIFHPENEGEAVLFPYESFIVFILFLIICTTVLMNLLVRNFV